MKRSAGIITFAIIGAVVGLFQVFLGLSGHDGFSMYTGICFIVLSISLLTLKPWVREVFISGALIFLLLNYVPIFVATFTIDPFYGVGLGFYFPAALFAFCSLFVLKRQVHKGVSP